MEQRKTQSYRCISLQEQHTDTELPTEVVIFRKEILENYPDVRFKKGDEDLSEAIGDILSNRYGYCHFGFRIDVFDEYAGLIKVSHIEWDTSD